MFEYFPGNYAWSSAVNLALMAGGSLGDIHRWLQPLRAADEPDLDAWASAWAAMAHQQELLAAEDVKAGYLASAGARYLRASVYHATGQRQLPPGPAKSEGYAAVLQAFGNAVDCAPFSLERIHVDSPDGTLPGYLIAPDAAKPQPVVIVYGGLDLTKELVCAIVGTTFARRGITCLVIDTPGVGEPLRLRGIPSRPDYEVPTAAIIDHLQTRHNVDARRVAVLGISLGGYYAARAAAFEPRVSACAAWGGNWDCGEVWQRRWDQRTTSDPGAWFILPWVMGTASMEEALVRVKQWSLVDVWPKVTQPLLIVHGENDRQIPVEDARRAFAAAGSTDKQLRVFTAAEGGAEHIQTDAPGPALDLIADWLALALLMASGVPEGSLRAG
ncbi:alpha/beta fold hydrolase [Dactylosporangium sp. NPDC050688]|uniref:alpha/beta hydrolase family protein n=1 Tax=Dactylosporangium sp. NPDC050688 TaxID=3157217 RepID=UPI0033D9145C